MAFFWKKMPSRTYVAKSQKTAGGFKVAKDRVTLLFCSNASGERMLKPLLVNSQVNDDNNFLLYFKVAF